MMIKAISLFQPWATAWVIRLKWAETRSWAPILGGALYHGPLAVHAAKTERDPQTGESLRAWFEHRLKTCQVSRAAFKEAGITRWEDLPRGAVVGLCTLDSAMPTFVCRQTSLESSWGNYSHGRFAWLPVNMTSLATPIPCTGRQKLFNWEVPAEVFGAERFAPIFRGARAVPVKAGCTPQERALGAPTQVGAASLSTVEGPSSPSNF